MRILALSVVVLSGALPSAAQEIPTADSLVAEFIRNGLVASWRPDRIFRDCERLDETSQRALSLLLEADLTPERSEDVAVSWLAVLQTCQPPAVVDWLLDEVEAGLREGRDAADMGILWMGLQRASMPRVRDRLREYMLDPNLPQSVRTWAGGSLFHGADREAKREEFTLAFRSGRMPDLLAIQIGAVMAGGDTDWTLRETARLVSEDPRLIQQTLFGQIVVSSRKAATGPQRERLARALEAIAERPTTPSHQRDVILSTVRGLRGGGG